VSSASITEKLRRRSLSAHLVVTVLVETGIDGSVVAAGEEQAHPAGEVGGRGVNLIHSNLSPLENRLCTRQFSGSFALVWRRIAD
jgi:hypothetical protein